MSPQGFTSISLAVFMIFGPYLRVARACEDPTFCLNGGTCIVNKYGRQWCQCSPVWQGDRCEEVRDPCEFFNPCRNSGVCVRDVTAASYKCKCPDAYTGLKCEALRRDDCRDRPEEYGCVNGNCAVQGKQYVCACPTFYEGERCQTFAGCRKGNPCKNDGSCSNVNIGEKFSFKCTCTADWEGVTCEKPREKCPSNPCQYSSLCTPTADGYRCDCVEGTSGDTCDVGCPHGFYDKQCANRCGHCEAITCDVTTGLCGKQGCQPGWVTDKCDKRDAAVVKVSIRLLGKFGKELEDVLSPQHVRLSTLVETWTMTICEEKLGEDKRCSVDNVKFTEGIGVNVDYDVLFHRENVDDNDLHRSLKRRLKSNADTFSESGYTVRPGSVMTSEVKLVSDLDVDDVSHSSRSKTIIIVLCAIVAVVVVSVTVIGYVFYSHRIAPELEVVDKRTRTRATTVTRRRHRSPTSPANSSSSSDKSHHSKDGHKKHHHRHHHHHHPHHHDHQPHHPPHPRPQYYYYYPIQAQQAGLVHQQPNPHNDLANDETLDTNYN